MLFLWKGGWQNKDQCCLCRTGVDKIKIDAVYVNYIENSKTYKCILPLETQHVCSPLIVLIPLSYTFFIDKEKKKKR